MVASDTVAVAVAAVVAAADTKPTPIKHINNAGSFREPAFSAFHYVISLGRPILRTSPEALPLLLRSARQTKALP